MKRCAILIRKENNDEENNFYIKAIEKFGGKVILIYDYEELENINVKLSEAEGILLTGGYDVGRLDFYLIEYALKNNLRLFGICQGMQSMALYNTNDKLESIGNNNHDKKEDYVHEVKLFPSKLKSIIEKDIIKVNSHHIQTVYNSKEFVVVGKSNDNLIEAIENSKHTFQIGVQWHPERMLDYDEVSNKLFDYFVNKNS